MNTYIFMLGAVYPTNKPTMLSVVEPNVAKLSVVMPSVVAPSLVCPLHVDPLLS